MKPALLLLAFGALASTGCAAMKETWNYAPVVKAPLSDGTAAAEVVAKSCKVPLRVAVKPFKTSRVGGNYGVVGVTGWVLSGLLLKGNVPEGRMRECLELIQKSAARGGKKAIRCCPHGQRSDE